MAFNPPPPPPEDADRHALISKLLSRLRCAACGRPIEPRECTVVDRRPDAWVMGLSCRRCRTPGYVIVVLELLNEKPPDELTADEQADVAHRPAITADDVLDLHFRLEDYDGDIDGLLHF